VARIGESGDLLKCSFCGKSQKQVKKLIAGPGVYICDECIDLCNEIIEEELSESSDLKFDELPKPKEIHAAEIQRVRAQMEEILARHTGRSVDQVRADIDRDKILTAQEAKEYGIVDEVIQSRKLNALPV
jgi:hypothetical protein